MSNVFFRKNMVALKVKSKSLEAESKIIRQEEKKRKPYMVNGFDSVHYSLYMHRTFDVRNEQRATQLARAFLKGREASNVEGNAKKHHPYENNLERLRARSRRIAYKYRRGSNVMENIKSGEDHFNLYYDEWFKRNFEGKHKMYDTEKSVRLHK